MIFQIYIWNLFKLFCTALVIAIEKGHIDVIKLLLKQKGIDINVKDFYLFYFMIISII